MELDILVEGNALDTLKYDERCEKFLRDGAVELFRDRAVGI